MARRKQSRGKCAFCGKEMTKGGLSKHLATCPERVSMIEQAGQKTSRKKVLVQLQVQDAWDPDFWLQLEMAGDATLSELDDYLRTIWLECCGHMSRFSFNGWRGEEISMRRTIGNILNKGDVLTHIYDFGTSSETQVKMGNTRTGASLSKHPIYLMGRNEMPAYQCMECDQIAAWYCAECQEYEQAGLLCETHVKDHPHDDYGDPIKIVNSPRLGMCGYSGPANPPY